MVFQAGRTSSLGGSTTKARSRAWSINDRGKVTGWWGDDRGFHGFVRSKKGAFTSYDDPGNLNSAYFSIDLLGNVYGSYSFNQKTGGLMMHGYERTATGKVVPFDPPNSIGTTPTGTDAEGIVTGYFLSEKTGTQLGFVRIP